MSLAQLEGPLKPCAQPGCRKLLRDATYCPTHERQRRKKRETKGYRFRGRSHRWDAASQAFRRENPLCEECQRQGRVTPATCVDHIKPVAQFPELMWDTSNWQALCHECHAIKTAAEVGAVATRKEEAAIANRVVVTGPPGCGKSTFAESRGGLRWDWDILAEALTGSTREEIQLDDVAEPLLEMREGFLRWAARDRSHRLTVIATNPDMAQKIAERIGAVVYRMRARRVNGKSKTAKVGGS